MKRLIALLVVGLMMLGFVSCTETDPEDTSADTVETEPVEYSSEDYSSYFDDNGYFKGVKASDIVTLPAYKGIEIPASVVEVSESTVHEQLSQYASQQSLFVEAPSKVIENMDTVNIDYVGSIGGVEFEGGNTNGQGTFVTIGVTSYIDDFLEQLIGHTPGETINVEVTFPDEYPNNPDLEGKDAVFVTTINYVCDPDKDALAELYGFASAEELVDALKDQIYDNQVSEFISTLMNDASCENVPQIAIDYAIASQINYLENMYAAYGMTFDSLVTSMGYESREAFIEDNMDGYKNAATFYLAIQAIAELEGIVATDEYLDKSGISKEELDQYGKPYFKQYFLMSDLVPEFIISNAVIVG